MEASVIELDIERIRDVCRQHRIAELHVFGSVLRSDFRPDSDVDFLLRPVPDHRITFSELLQIEDELAAICRRPVDIVLRSEIDAPDANPIRKSEVLSTMQPIYAVG